MRHRLDARHALDRAHCSIIRGMLGEQRVGVGPAVEGLQFHSPGGNQRARQRVAVGVQADRGKPDDRVARYDALHVRESQRPSTIPTIVPARSK